MCKEMPVILVNRIVDMKIIIRKNGGGGGEEAQGVADPPKRLFFFVKTLKIFVELTPGPLQARGHREEPGGAGPEAGDAAREELDQVGGAAVHEEVLPHPAEDERNEKLVNFFEK
jgi:hypothetical protein